MAALLIPEKRFHVGYLHIFLARIRSIDSVIVSSGISVVARCVKRPASLDLPTTDIPTLTITESTDLSRARNM